VDPCLERSDVPHLFSLSPSLSSTSPQPF
jgi:hypothetical protein